MTAVLSASRVSLQLDSGRILFQNLSFSIDPGVSALVGVNGVGKTTLARLLTGELVPTTGSIKRVDPPLLLAQAEIPPVCSVTDHLATSYVWSELGERLLERVDRERLCSELSGGEWMRVRLACSLQDRFIILDEPTNNLDSAGREAVSQFIRGCKAGVLIISHDRDCLALCERVYELSNRGLQVYGGNFDFYWAEKEREKSLHEASLDQAKRKRAGAHAAHLEQVNKQEKRQRKGAKDAKRGGIPRILLGKRRSQAQATAGKVKAAALEQEALAEREVSQAFAALKESPLMYASVTGGEMPAQKLVAEAQGYNVHWGRWLYQDDLTFFLRGPVRVALRGENGSGKSTLLRALAGHSASQDAPRCRGALIRGDVQTIYLDQRLSLLDDSASVIENVRRHSHKNDSELRTGLAQFLFTKDRVFQQVAQLSGGEKLRAALALGF